MEANLAPSWPSREGAAPAAPLQRPAEEIELPLEEAVAQAEEADEVMAAGLRSGGGGEWWWRRRSPGQRRRGWRWRRGWKVVEDGDGRQDSVTPEADPSPLPPGRI
ncbi:hypothetical protein OsJ_11368 [Oryza sativa Japonica Group]|uniref:Uncharacterized protein n=1 Tax=Oryza sativa subsp. japonica TaxID=39947 RepID=B9F963_ORYSJ|nr:hypothetical protein OsJ_11368 [Oryza sativa Japonica Group]